MSGSAQLAGTLNRRMAEVAKREAGRLGADVGTVRSAQDSEGGLEIALKGDSVRIAEEDAYFMGADPRLLQPDDQVLADKIADEWIIVGELNRPLAATNRDNFFSSNQSILGQHNGLFVGVREDYEPPREGDFVVADSFGYGAEPGRKGTIFGGSELIGRVGGIQVDRPSQRLNVQGGLRMLAIGDNAQMRFGRGPGWGHGFPIGAESVVRRRPVGQAAFVGTPTAPGASDVYIFPAKTFGNYFDDRVYAPIAQFLVDGQSCTYTSKVNINATISGDLEIGDTEMLVAEGGPTQTLPDAGPWRIRSLQGTYSGKELVFDGVVEGVHKAGTPTLLVRNVTQAEWDTIPHGAGAFQTERVTDGVRSFKYLSATYDSVAEKVTFTIDTRTHIDRNVIDGAPVKVHRLTGITCDWPHFTVGEQPAGSRTLIMRLIDPYPPHNPVDPELIAKIPPSGMLRVETKDRAPLGPGKVDYPTWRGAYEDFNYETGEITLVDSLPREVPEWSYIEIEGCTGFLRERPSGIQLAMHKLGGVQGLIDGAEVGGVVEFSPRYGQPSSGEGGAHIALDYWAGHTGYQGYSTNMGITHIGGVIGFGAGPPPQKARPGAAVNQMVRVPVSGTQRQVTTTMGRGFGVLGAGFRGYGDWKHSLNVGEVYCRVKPPNVTIEEECDCDPEIDPDCECDPDDPDDEPGEPGSGQIASATVNTDSVIGFPTAAAQRRIKVFTHNRQTGTSEFRVLSYTGVTEGPPPSITGITFDQSAYGPKTTLQGSHDLASITELDVVSEAGFPIPAVQHKGKLRAKNSGGTVIATFTYTARPNGMFTGVEVVTGTGILPDGTLIEENYAITDFWLDSGAEISLADDVRHAAIGSATNIVAGADRGAGKQVEIGLLDNKLQGIQMGALTIYERTDGLLGTGATDILATRGYVDLGIQGVKWKATARVATTANVTLSGLQTIDGVPLADNDRVLVWKQTTGSQNGPYNAHAGAWTRTTDSDSSTELEQATIATGGEGTALANRIFLQTATPVTLGVTALTFEQILTLADLVAGAGLIRSGNLLDVGQGDGISVGADTIAVDSTVARRDAANTFTERLNVAPVADITGLEVRRGTDTGPVNAPFRVRDFADTVTLARIDAFGKVFGTGLDAGGQKITGGADGVAATDFATVGQLPTGLPPSGPAGGALDGTFPNPGLAAAVAGDGLAEIGDVLSVKAGGALGIVSDEVRVTDSELVALTGVSSAANRLPYFTGPGTAATTIFTAKARDLLDDADAETMRETLEADDGVVGYHVPTGTTRTIKAGHFGIMVGPIQIDGVLQIDGKLVEVN